MFILMFIHHTHTHAFVFNIEKCESLADNEIFIKSKFLFRFYSLSIAIYSHYFINWILLRWRNISFYWYLHLAEVKHSVTTFTDLWQTLVEMKTLSVVCNKATFDNCQLSIWIKQNVETFVWKQLVKFSSQLKNFSFLFQPYFSTRQLTSKVSVCSLRIRVNKKFRFIKSYFKMKNIYICN